MNPFKYLNEINYGKRNIMVDEETEKAYVPFVINRSLSYFPDTVALANEMNRYGHLESRLQFAFLIYTIRKRKRFWLMERRDCLYSGGFFLSLFEDTSSRGRWEC